MYSPAKIWQCHSLWVLIFIRNESLIILYSLDIFNSFWIAWKFQQMRNDSPDFSNTEGCLGPYTDGLLFEDCLPQILLGIFWNSLSHMSIINITRLIHRMNAKFTWKQQNDVTELFLMSLALLTLTMHSYQVKYIRLL